MFDALAVAVVVLIAWIAYQITALRVESTRRHAETLANNRRSELDQELVRLCPNVASSLTFSDLRQ